MAVKQITEYLPSYIDTVQNEYFILFQQILESQEGICNMLLEYDKRAYNDLRNMMNIWRERLPHKCETIQTWQDVLENRRFIYQLLLSKISKQMDQSRRQHIPGQPGPHGQSVINTVPGAMGHNGMEAGHDLDPQMHKIMLEKENRKLLEQVDIVWINLKLAEISRKHGMPNLAEHYQSLSKMMIKIDDGP